MSSTQVPSGRHPETYHTCLVAGISEAALKALICTLRAHSSSQRQDAGQKELAHLSS